MLRGSLIAVLILALGVPALAQAGPGKKLRANSNGVKAIGTFNVREDPTLGNALNRFGQPSKVDDQGEESCKVAWSDLGLVILFVNLGGDDACHPSFGRAQSAAIRGEKGERWRTSQGLRIGHDKSEIPERHPNAIKKSKRVWWIAHGFNFVTGGQYGWLKARVKSGEVSKFSLWIGAAGE